MFFCVVGDDSLASALQVDHLVASVSEVSMPDAMVIAAIIQKDATRMSEAQIVVSGGSLAKVQGLANFEHIRSPVIWISDYRLDEHQNQGNIIVVPAYDDFSQTVMSVLRAAGVEVPEYDAVPLKQAVGAEHMSSDDHVVIPMRPRTAPTEQKEPQPVQPNINATPEPEPVPANTSDASYQPETPQTAPVQQFAAEHVPQNPQPEPAPIQQPAVTNELQPQTVAPPQQPAQPQTAQPFQPPPTQPQPQPPHTQPMQPAQPTPPTIIQPQYQHPPAPAQPPEPHPAPTPEPPQQQPYQPPPTPAPQPVTPMVVQPPPAPPMAPTAPVAPPAQHEPQPETPPYQTFHLTPEPPAPEPEVIAPAQVVDSQFPATPWLEERSHQDKRSRTGQVFCVCAAKGGVGKSTLSLWLTETLNTLGHSTVIVDGNIAQPDLLSMVGTWSDNPGLSALIKPEGQRFAPDELNRVLVEIPKLGWVLPGPQNAIKVAQGPALKALVSAVEELKTKYEYVIVDTPVAQAYEMVMYSLVKPLADFVVMICTPHLPTMNDTRKWLQDACSPIEQNGLEMDPNKFLGVITKAADSTEKITVAQVIEWIPDLNVAATIPKIDKVNAQQNQIKWQRPPEAQKGMLELVDALTGGDALTNTDSPPKKTKPKRGLLRKAFTK